MIEAIRVSALVRYLKELLESDLRLSHLWVEGEITNLSRSQRGHTYFSLKDGDYQLRCVMFQSRYQGLPLENGAQVLAHGNVSLYEQRGDVQLVVDFVQPAGIGARQAEFERLKEKLQAEGLFDPARKRPLPTFPMRIGVVTSPAGAVFHDICNVLGRRWPLAEVVLAPTAVQGPEAAPGIAEAVRALNEERGIDVIIVARGGGSVEELWAFNEEIVARAIFASGVPIVSAIGHETDLTIVDFVADRRAPTPSAAAEMVAPDWREVSRHIEGAMQASLLAIKSRLAQALRNVEHAGHRLRTAAPDMSRLRERLASLLHRGQMALDRSLEQRSQGVDSFAQRLRALDPGGTLARGYAVVQLRDARLAITSVSQVKGRDRLDIYVKDGRFPAEVARQYGF
jgi:exodeoxyribonuclease VII large subunit